MKFPRVKVCGLARPQDAIAAVAAGADAVGVVHYPPSPRSIEAEQAVAIFDAAQQAATSANQNQPLHVAVMVDVTPEEARQWMHTANATAIQLCGAEHAGDWRDFPAPILRRIGVDETGSEQMRDWQNIASGFVLDHPASAGGSGKTVDVEIARELSRLAPCLLAGGLGADNVAAAIRQVQPWGVDASSRLEQRPGAKDHDLTEQFVINARAALSSLSPR